MDESGQRIERLDEAIIREGRIKHALKTALSCTLAALAAFFFHIPGQQMAPVFAYVLMTIGMPSPRVNYLMTLATIAASSVITAVLVIVLYASPFFYLLVTFVLLSACVFFANWFPTPSLLALLSSTVALFTSLESNRPGATLDFLASNYTAFFIGGLSVLIIKTFLWPANAQRIFLHRVVEVYGALEADCRRQAEDLRRGAPPRPAESPADWAPFRPLRRLLAPAAHGSGRSTDPIVQLIISCRNLNLRLWFFGHAIITSVKELPEGERHMLARRLDWMAARLSVMARAALDREPVAGLDTNLDGTIAGGQIIPGAHSPLIAHAIHHTLLSRARADLQAAAVAQNQLLNTFDTLRGELASVRAFTIDKPLFNLAAAKVSIKLIAIIIVLLGAVLIMNLPGGTQVAFYAAFFGATVNLGRQTKTDVIGLGGLLCGFAYGVLAAIITTKLPFFLLVLAFLFFGQFLASMAFQAFPRYGVAGLQAGLAIPFAYLATPGPGWGSFTTIGTRLAALIVAGTTAVLIHTYIWPTLPIRQLRALIASTLRDVATSLDSLFEDFAAWTGPPTSLNDLTHQAHDLIDDARFLPGPDRPDPDYNAVIRALQEVDAYLEHMRLLLGYETDSWAFRALLASRRAYPRLARAHIASIAAQFQDSDVHAAPAGPIQWTGNEVSRCEAELAASGEIESESATAHRLLVLAECLDRIAAAITRISRLAHDINARAL